MNSIKCPNCNLVNFATAETCKKCGNSLTTLPNTKPLPNNSNLFACPDCQNLCSITAPNCPSCGKVFNAAPVYITEPPKKTSPFTWFVLLVILAVPIFCCLSSSDKNSRSEPSVSASQPNDPKSHNNPEGRQKFANGLQQMALENHRLTVFDAEGFENKTLSLKANNVTQKDCLLVAAGDYGKTAASVGFNKMVCRNPVENAEWTFTLTP